MLYSFIFSSPSLSYSQTCIFLSISSPSCVNTVSLRNASLPKQERNFLHSEPAPGILSLCLYRWQPPVVCLFNVFTELPVAIYPVAFPCQSNGVQVNRHSRCSMAERPICSERYTGQKAFTVDDKRERLNYCRGTAWISIGKMAVFTPHSDTVPVCVHAKKRKKKKKKKVIHTTEKSAVGSGKKHVPLQTLQHLPSGKICSLRVQFRSGQVSVTFTIRPFWKDRTQARHRDFRDGVRCVKGYALRENQFSTSYTIWSLIIFKTATSHPQDCFFNQFFSYQSHFLTLNT